jgi:hypothetical protein
MSASRRRQRVALLDVGAARGGALRSRDKDQPEMAERESTAETAPPPCRMPLGPLAGHSAAKYPALAAKRRLA